MIATRPAIAAIVAAVIGLCGDAGPEASAHGAPAVNRPEAAPAIYASANYRITFPTPTGSTYCPLPEDWMGSDHGTTIFLTPPDRCDDGGAYASSERGALRAPNIQVYYQFRLPKEDEPPPHPEACEEIGRTRLLGRDRRLCVLRTPEHVEVSVEATYLPFAEDGGRDGLETIFTLVTSTQRLTADMETFRTLLERTSLCTRWAVELQPGVKACSADAEWF